MVEIGTEKIQEPKWLVIADRKFLSVLAHSWPTPDPSFHITSVLCTEFLSGPRQVLELSVSRRNFEEGQIPSRHPHLLEDSG